MELVRISGLKMSSIMESGIRIDNMVKESYEEKMDLRQEGNGNMGIS